MKSILFSLYLFSGSFLFAQINTNSPVYSTFLANDVRINEEVSTSEIKKITYEDHLHEAQSFDIPLIESNDHLDSLVLMNKLIAIPEIGEGYKIQKLTHSKAYLNDSAYLLLKEISSFFYKESGKDLSISSLTRTIENQNKLRRVNGNAAKGDSAHNYGVSFDISYNKYGDKTGRNYALERMLENILIQMTDEGKLYYIKERSQPCFHVTLRNLTNKI